VSLHIRWFRIVAGAMLIELALLAVAIPLNMSEGGRTALLTLVVPLCLVAAFLGGWWVARGAEQSRLLHGLFAGALAALIYAALTWRVALPTVYIVANYVKLIAGAGGGVVAQILRPKKPPNGVPLH
jgi:putative membrane protein (TIGR04086 family)